jgi:endonuclease YncB( thermonuclease family)
VTRRRRRGLGAATALAVAIAAGLAVHAGCGGRGAPEREPREQGPAPESRAEPAPPREAAPAATRTCVRVVDGDTILLDGGERVRLIGVDTPELHRPDTPVQYFAREAKAFTRRLAEHRRVGLAYDQEREDKYGRTLAYVYLADGTFLNWEIVRQGYGFAYTRHPFRHMSEFRAAERAARESSAGLWAHPGEIGQPANE